MTLNCHAQYTHITNTPPMNPNTHYATLFVESLAQAGLRHVCIAPGSRSTPLTLAFDAHEKIEVHLHLDERCAAFFALGLALATDTPVAMVCTSGSAAANFFPAIIEANMSQVPLLVLTADRPHELRHSGANQTIDQVKLYGDHVLWAVDAPLPEADAPAVALRNIQSTAQRAFATANGLRKGVVHVNFPFRKPLEPGAGELEIGDWRLGTGDWGPRIGLGRILPMDEQLDELARIVEEHPNGILVCGPRCPDGEFPEAVAALSRRTGYPIFADPTSGVRYGPWVENTAVISSYETFMQAPMSIESPDVIIRFGAVPISKWLNDYLTKAEAKHRIHIRQNGVWADDSHLVNWFLQVDETAVCDLLSDRRDGEGATGRQGDLLAETFKWLLQKIDIKSIDFLQNVLADDHFDGSCVTDVLQAMPDDSLLFMGNSLPIRHLDQYGFATSKAIDAYASRGASGIDGNISTALGMHVGSGKKLILVIGDVTFYHDLNGLLYVKRLLDQDVELDITVVLINNNGGGIFNRLPVSKFEPPFTKLFITPHQLDFEPVIRMYGLGFERIVLDANGRSAFQAALQTHLNRSAPSVIELMTNGNEDERIRKEINSMLKEEIKRMKHS
ncbi:MAG: 2-succinyl-5-enolpyruvyl-6-hydroxy-3-cyclohexene-1-carboxylic-acid synthase [Chloroflexota bacterium]